MLLAISRLLVLLTPLFNIRPKSVVFIPFSLDPLHRRPSGKRPSNDLFLFAVQTVQCWSKFDGSLQPHTTTGERNANMDCSNGLIALQLKPGLQVMCGVIWKEVRSAIRKPSMCHPDEDIPRPPNSISLAHRIRIEVERHSDLFRLYPLRCAA